MIDMEKMGKLIQKLRKEKQLTQKQLADELGVSDKAVSKWERGISIPDANLFEPLSQLLGITLTELLHGEIIENPISKEESDSLIKDSLNLAENNRNTIQNKRMRIKLFVITVCSFILSLLIFAWMKKFPSTSFLVIFPMLLVFQIYFTFFVKETLPKYYDENKISYYSDGFFRIHIAGIYFNNQNWGPIIQALCIGLTCCSIFTLLILGAALYFKLSEFISSILILIIFLLCLFAPVVLQARRYSK